MSRVEVIVNRSPVKDLLARHKKQSDVTLYRVLADCLEIVELCQKSKLELVALNQLIKDLPKINNARFYIEKSSDIFQRTCRFMFHGEEHNANTNRYAHCLREATRQGVTSTRIFDELRSGGVNRFFLTRPSQTLSIATKTIRLDRQIQHPKGNTIKLKLKRNIDNTYQVLEFASGL